jgi:hypothetical protein
MSLVAMPKPQPEIAELQSVLDEAQKRLGECDCVLVLMQKRDNGLLYFAPGGTPIATVGWLAQSFIHYLHTLKRED